MKVLFVDCLNSGNFDKWKEIIPIAPRRITGILKEKKVEFEFLTYFDFLKRKKVSKNFNVLMVSGMLTDLKQVRNVRILWNKYSKGLKIVGGPITDDPKVALRRAGYDIAVVGEGEPTIEKLIEISFDKNFSYLRKIENLAFEKNGKIVRTEKRTSKIKEIEKFKNNNQIIKKYPFYFASKVYVEVVRGCSNFRRVRENCLKCNLCLEGPLEKRIECPAQIPPGCGYCSVPSTFGPSKSISENFILEEIKELVKLGVRRIVLEAPDILDYGREELVKPNPLTDPRNPMPNTRKLISLFEKIFQIEKIKKGNVSVLIENIKACLINKKVAEILGKYFKNSEIHLGCETGDAEHAERIGRPVYPHEVIKAVKVLREVGLKPHVYFIYGLPFQTREAVEKTIKVMEECVKNGAERILIYRFLPLPSSAFSSFHKANKNDPLNMKIRKRVEKINFELKKRLVGKIRKYIIVERIRNYFIGYPLKEGPTLMIKGEKLEIGKIYKVRIKGIIRGNLLIGEVA